MKLKIMPDFYSIYHFKPDIPIPLAVLTETRFVSITRTPDELSIVCRSQVLKESDVEESGWRLLQVAGPLDFSMVGVLSSLSYPLAEAGISIFVISTYDTDYILVKEDQLEQTCHILTDQGHRIDIVRDQS